ncbi:PA2169 family four-helix-bundle protein [Flavobacterium sp.]
METKIENSQKVLGIFEKSIDAEKGFKSAANYATRPHLRNYFLQKSAQRGKFIEELRMELLKNDNSLIDTSGSIIRDLQRTWFDVKAFFSSNNEDAILEESMKSEKEALAKFDEVLDEEYLNLHLRDILSKQFDIIKSDFETFTSLEAIEEVF